MLKYVWEVGFEDGTNLRQPEDDRYSKHDAGKDHNPSSFKDLLDYSEVSKPLWFALRNESGVYCFLDMLNWKFSIDGVSFKLEQPLEELTDRKLIYFRTMRLDMLSGLQGVYAYNIGYEGKDPKGKVIKKVITL